MISADRFFHHFSMGTLCDLSREKEGLCMRDRIKISINVHGMIAASAS